MRLISVRYKQIFRAFFALGCEGQYTQYCLQLNDNIVLDVSYFTVRIHTSC